MASIDVQIGKIYWVELDGTRLRVRAVEKSPSIPQWWKCMAPMGTEIMVPESAFCQLCGDDSGFLP